LGITKDDVETACENRIRWFLGIETPRSLSTDARMVCCGSWLSKKPNNEG
jgi:hypothetical protein